MTHAEIGADYVLDPKKMAGKHMLADMASVERLQKLEQEFARIHAALDAAFATIVAEGIANGRFKSKPFRKCSRSLANAGRRLHKDIEKLANAEGE